MAAIAESLSALDPENAATYADNAAAATVEMQSLIDDIQERMGPLADRPFIVFHDAYHYFEARFGMSAVGAISLSDATDPSPARVAEIRDLVAARNIACVFAEPQFNRGIVFAVFEGSGAAVGMIDPVGVGLEAGPGFYPALIRGMADSFESCL
jgi:zinc transport system substrate-binding protein